MKIDYTQIIVDIKREITVLESVICVDVYRVMIDNGKRGKIKVAVWMTVVVGNVFVAGIIESVLKDISENHNIVLIPIIHYIRHC